jgi:glycosyltransferase involved in cell wall biosynthesis
MRLTAVMTHPVQYYAPWFRYIAANSDVDLTVVYAAEPDPVQQGGAFGVAFDWDVPLRDGYRSVVVRPRIPGARFDSSTYEGVDVAEIGEVVEGTRPDVVLVPGWHSRTFIRTLVHCRRRGIPVLYRGDTNLASGRSGWQRPVWTLRTAALLRLFSGYLSVGRRSREYLEHFRIPGNRIFASPHCVDNAYFRATATPLDDLAVRAVVRGRLGISPGAFTILFVGRFEASKRAADVLHAAARLDGETHVFMVGSGQLESELRSLAEGLGVRVTWAGFMNQSQLGEAYGAADCLALPSDGRETWGLVVNEAMAAGLPCVVSERVGCAPDLVRAGVTGETHRFGDVDDLAAALEKIRERSGDRAVLREACVARAQRHSLAAATVGLEAACERVARRALSGSFAGAVPPRLLALCGGMVVMGGAERMVLEVLRTAREAGCAVHGITNDWENWRVAQALDDLGASWSTGHYRYALFRRERNPLRWLALLGHILRTQASLFRDVMRVRPTLILVAEFRHVLVNGPVLLLARIFGSRVVLRLPVAPDPGRFYRFIWRYAVNPFVDLIVANSEFTRAEVLTHGIAPSRVRRIYNAVPASRQCAADVRERVRGRVIFVGQIIPEKGLRTLLEAIALLCSRGFKHVHLQVVGDADGWEAPNKQGYRSAVRARASEPDLAGRVTFLGWREDVPELLAAAEIHCCPSEPAHREAFGIVNIEAKQVGTPSVVTPYGGVPELISHGVDGWVCADSSPEAMAEGIAFFLDDDGRREAAGEAARRSLVRFSREAFEAAWRDVLGVRKERTERIDDEGRLSGHCRSISAPVPLPAGRDR